jgi:hypothetical protein
MSGLARGLLGELAGGADTRNHRGAMTLGLTTIGSATVRMEVTPATLPLVEVVQLPGGDDRERAYGGLALVANERAGSA